MTTDGAAGSEESSKEFDAAFAQFAAGDASQDADAEGAGKAAADGTEADKAEAAAATNTDADKGDGAGASTEATDAENASNEEGETGAAEAAAKNAKDKGSDDPWAVVPEPLRNDFKKLQHETRSNRGRISALQRENDKKQAEINRLAAIAPAADEAAVAGKDGKTKPSSNAALFEQPVWKQFKTDYGEVAAPIESVVKSVLAENDTIKRELGSISQDRREANLADQWDSLVGIHEDAPVIAGSDAFKAWVADQPIYVQQAVRRNSEVVVDGAEAAHIITQFKDQTGFVAAKSAGSVDPNAGGAAGKSKRERQLEAAVGVQGKGPGAGGGPPDDFESAFKHFAAKS